MQLVIDSRSPETATRAAAGGIKQCAEAPWQKQTGKHTRQKGWSWFLYECESVFTPLIVSAAAEASRGGGSNVSMFIFITPVWIFHFHSERALLLSSPSPLCSPTSLLCRHTYCTYQTIHPLLITSYAFAGLWRAGSYPSWHWTGGRERSAISSYRNAHIVETPNQ